MSDTWLKFVPEEPGFQPSREAADAAVGLLNACLPNAEEITAEYFEQVQFIDPGGNWSGVQCPNCSTDIEEWWQDAMSEAVESDFEQLEAVAPCCRAKVSLNDLAYVWPAGFGKFVLAATNPGVSDLAPEQERALSKRLGHRLRKIWVHI